MGSHSKMLLSIPSRVKSVTNFIRLDFAAAAKGYYLAHLLLGEFRHQVVEILCRALGLSLL